jgi:putative PIN family toxin of toxin-antitoxin system
VPLRVVFDTNVLLSLFIFADSRFAPLLREVDAGRWLTYSNAACFGEFRRVLGYPMFDLSPERQATAAAAWQQRFIPVDADAASPVDLPRCKDRDDQKFLELTRDASADWLVTADKALLKLARRDKLRGLFRILTPEVALAEL